MRLTKLLSQNSASSIDKSAFTQIWEEIKRPTNVPFFMLIFWKIVSTLQILAMMLEIGCSFFENTDGSWSVLGVARFFIFRKKFNFEEKDSVTEAFFLISCLAVLVNYLFYAATVIGTKLRISGPCLAALGTRFYMILYQYVLFIPIHMFMMEVIETCKDKNINMFGSTNDTLFMIIGAIVVIMNFIGGLINTKCYSSLYAQKTYCKRNAYLAIADFLFKAGAGTLIVATPSTESAKWILICFMLVYIGIMHTIFHYQLPFFQIKFLEVYCVLLGAKVSFGVVMFFVAVFDEFWEVQLPDLPLSALVLTLPIGIAGQFHLMWKTLMNTATFDERNYKSENDIFIHLLGLRYLIKKGSVTSLKNGKMVANDWNLQLHGVIIRHNAECNNALCGCRSFLEIEDTSKGLGPRRDKYRELKILLMRNLYEKGVEVVPFSELLLLNLAQFYLLYLENYLKSYLVLQAFEERAHRSFETEVLIGYIKKKIQERMELKLSGALQQGSLIAADYESNNLNVTALVQNDVLFLQLKNLVSLQVNRQLKFWDLFENFELNTRQVESCCEEVDMIRSRIEKLWESLSQINQKCSSHYLLYGLYQSLINNTTRRGERYLNDYSRMYGINLQENEAITNENLYDPSTVIIRISMRRDKIGTIEESSGDLENIFGYQPSEIIDSNVVVVMSQFFKERHHNFVMNHFEEGTENALNKIKRLYGYHKDGHIFPIFLYVSIYPNIEKGLSYMGIIRPRKVYNNYILVKHDGTVDSYSPEIAEYLSLESRKKYNITDLCPEFEKINWAFNYVTKRKYTNLYDEELPDYKADSLSRKSNDYQLKVTNAESKKLDGKGEDEVSKMVSGSQPLLNSMNTDNYEGGNPEASATATASGDQEHKRLGSLDTRDYGSVSKPTKERSKEGIKTIGGKAPRNQLSRKLRRLNTEDIEEYQKIYDQMSVNGSVLNFSSQANKNEIATRSYLCTVSDEIFDYSILRIITLGRNDEANEGDKDLDTGLKNPNRAITEPKVYSPKSKPTNKKTKKEVMEISILDATDKGISDMPNQEAFQTFKNPFSPEENNTPRESNLLPTEGGALVKETIHNLLTANQEGLESQLNFSSRKDISELRDNQSSKMGYAHNKSDTSRNEMEQFDDKYHDSKDFIQELMLNADGKNKNIEVSSMSSGTLRGGGGVISKLESLLYKKTRGRSSNKFKIYYGIIGICIILAIVDVAVSLNFLNTGSERVQMMLYVGGRINYLLNLYFQVVTLNLSLKGLITADRHLATLGIADYPYYMYQTMRPAAEMLLDANAQVMNDIGNLQESSKDKFYQNQVTIQYPSTASSADNIASLNSFLAVDTLARSALEIASVPYADLSTMQENIDYILLNSVNDLYLEMANSYKIYEEDLEDHSSKGRLIAWGMGIAAISIYILFCILLLRDMATTYQDKIRFWNSLVKLDTERSVSHKKMLHVIKDNLEGSSNYSLLKRALIDAKKQEAKIVKTSKDKATQGGAFKRLKTYKFQNRNYFIVLPFMVIFVIILVFFIVSAARVGSEATNKKVYITELINAQKYYQLNTVAMNGMYQYIDQGSSSKIEGVAVLTAVNSNLAQLAKLADFVNSFETKNDFSPRAYLQMDYCSTFTTATETTACRGMASGLVTHGIMGILTYTKDAISGVMDYITSITTPTTADKIDALSQDSLISMESVWPYMSDGFESLFRLLSSGELDSQDSFQSNMIVFIVVFVILLIILNYLMVLTGFKKLDGQKFDNMKILRVIPVSMILESKMLKTYLLKSFKDDLSSVKNKM